MSRPPVVITPIGGIDAFSTKKVVAPYKDGACIDAFVVKDNPRHCNIVSHVAYFYPFGLVGGLDVEHCFYTWLAHPE